MARHRLCNVNLRTHRVGGRGDIRRHHPILRYQFRMQSAPSLYLQPGTKVELRPWVSYRSEEGLEHLSDFCTAVQIFPKSFLW